MGESIKVVIIGKRSFIGYALFCELNDHIEFDPTLIGHDVTFYDVNDYDVVVNCSIAPEYSSQKYDAKFDMDFKWAKDIKSDTRFIMISTRKVYGYSESLMTYNEDSPIKPFDYYSENKAITETFVRNNIENHTILRGSNLFGFEYGKKSFMGYCMNQLKSNGRIRYNLDPSIKRDFIDIHTSCRMIKEIINQKVSGTFNLSANRGLEIGKISEYLIDGFGSGELYIESPGKAEQFIIDNKKLEHATNCKILEIPYHKIISDLGRELRNLKGIS